MRVREMKTKSASATATETRKATLRALFRNTEMSALTAHSQALAERGVRMFDGVEPKTMSPAFAMMSERPSVRMSCG